MDSDSTSAFVPSSSSSDSETDDENKMVVLSDKIDYGSFAEPPPAGPSPGEPTSLIVSSSSSANNANANNAGNHKHPAVDGNSNNSSKIDSGGGSGSAASTPNARSRPVPNPTVVVGVSLDLGRSQKSTSSSVSGTPTSPTSEDLTKSLDETAISGRGTRSRASKQRTFSGNNNLLSVLSAHTHSNKNSKLLSPTETIVVITTGSGKSGKTPAINGTSIHTYSNSSSPMSTNSGDLLYQRQPLLQECENGWVNHESDITNDLDLDTPLSSDGGGNGKRGRTAVRIDIPTDQSVVTLKRYPKEKRKTVIAFLILCCNFILATFSIALTHERVPDRHLYKPLPDIVLDSLTPQDWALDVSDILVALSTIATAVTVLLHRHRWIVFRRIFLILACLYFYRSITIYVTVLPVASYTYYCSPKSNSTTVLEILRRVVKLVSGMGLSINGQHTYCGDYIYSGHTVILVTAYLFIQEYTPRKLFYVHWASWIASCLGIVMMLISRGHYTVDILIAYYIATRLFWIYHTLSNNSHLKLPMNGQNGTTTNFLGRSWWFPLFRYMEGNVGGPLPRQFSLPWTSPRERSRRNI